ncbi:MAG TPA: hypothetical protein VF846_04715 [Thermoanaerobaculia bacterium]|jgi:hypothetical protein
METKRKRAVALLETRLASVPPVVAALTGAIAAIAVMPLLPLLKPLFPVPGNGIGIISISGYPKGWDYAVVSILFVVPVIVAALLALVWRRNVDAAETQPDVIAARKRSWIACLVAMLIVTAAMIPARDHPYDFMDPYHEGEHLSPASVMLAGGAPYRDVFFMHGLATDGGLDLLVLGDPPSPVRARRAKAFLGALTIAFLVPIAAEVAVTWLGFAAAVLASMAVTGTALAPAFPYFRWLPLLLMIWWTLLFLRTRRSGWLVAAATIASAGLLWSLDIGLFATAGFWGWMIARHLLLGSGGARVSRRTAIACVTMAALTPIAILLAVRGDVSRFFRDSFLRLPEGFDAIYSIPAPQFPELAAIVAPAGLLAWLDTESARYYIPPITYGIVAALAWLAAARGRRVRGEAMLLLALTGMVQFRSAAGRVAWSHTRIAIPLFGLAFVAFLLEPLVRSAMQHRGWQRPALAVLAALLLFGSWTYMELPESSESLQKFHATYSRRLKPPPEFIPTPLPRANGMYTYLQEAADLDQLYRFSEAMPPGPMFDFSGEKAIYYLLDRPASTRQHDIPYMSNPKLGREARRQLERNRPVFVLLKGHEGVAKIDGVTNAQRTPWLAAWIDQHYPQRLTYGRFTVALPANQQVPWNVAPVSTRR